MMTIGMGKIIGATELHTNGMDMFGELLPKIAKFIMSKKNFLFGVGMVENAADETAIIEAVPAEQVFEREPVLQAMAKEMMARICFDEVDVLIVEQIGKNISGAGMDPNITGRNNRFIEWEAEAAGEEDRRAGPDARDARQRLRHRAAPMSSRCACTRRWTSPRPTPTSSPPPIWTAA